MSEQTTVADVVADAAEQPRPRNVVFAAPADDPRARRPNDVVELVLALLVFAAVARTHQADTDLDQRVSELFAMGLPGWISAIFTIVFIAGGVYTAGLIIAVLFFGHGRFSMVRDMLMAAALAILGATGASLLAGPEWPDIIPELLERDGVPSFPVTRIAVVLAVVNVANPYLSLPMRRVGRRLWIAMALAATVLGYGTVSAIVGGIALGIAAAAAVHLLFGSGVGIPSKDRILDALRSIELESDSIRFLEDQPIGTVLLRGEVAERGDVLVKVYGRDAADAAMAARVWRSIWFRDTQRALTATSMQQVEHESLMLLEGERARLPVPELVGWGRGDAGDALVVTGWLDGARLSDLSEAEISDATLGRCWDAIAALHDAHMAHREIDANRVVVFDDRVVLDDLSGATMSPDPMTRSTDVAQMLVVTAVAVGPERAISAAQAAIGDEWLVEALPLLQSNALSSSLQGAVKQADFKLKELRAEVADALGSEQPELVQLQRVTWSNVAMVGLTFFAASALISSLADIGFDTIVDQLASARVEWVLVAFVLAQLTNVGEYISLSGMVARPVPFGPTIIFRYAISFISLAVPSDAGAIAMNIRYMQKLGVSAAAAVAQGPLLTVFSKGFDVILLVLASRAIGQTVDLDDVDSGAALRLLLLAIGVIVVGIIVTFTVPKLRRRVLPHVQDGLGAVRGAITDPQRLLRVAGGTILQKVLFALTLAASVGAYDGSLTFGQAIFVNSAVSLLIGLVPVPGGIGVGEAALTAGLVAVGVPEGSAMAAAITHRMVTSYLPPIYGWYATRWLGDRDYL